MSAWIMRKIICKSEKEEIENGIHATSEYRRLYAWMNKKSTDM